MIPRDTEYGHQLLQEGIDSMGGSTICNRKREGRKKEGTEGGKERERASLTEGSIALYFLVLLQLFTFLTNPFREMKKQCGSSCLSLSVLPSYAQVRYARNYHYFSMSSTGKCQNYWPWG